MTSDINLFGVFIDSALVTALLAAAAAAVLHRLLAGTRAYRWVWHPPLVDLCLFALLWLAFALASAGLEEPLAKLIG